MFPVSALCNWAKAQIFPPQESVQDRLDKYLTFDKLDTMSLLLLEINEFSGL